MRILLIEATKNIKNKSAIVHRLAKFTERVGHTLHLLEVIDHGEVTLEEVAEFGVEEEGASLLVADELFLDAEPDAASKGAVMISESSAEMVFWSHPRTVHSMRAHAGTMGKASSEST